MVDNIIWVHEKALNKTQLALLAADKQSRAVFIWDNHYFQERSYSLKRLVFIYETLCQMPVEIINGNIIDVINSFAVNANIKITTSFTADTKINSIIKKLSESYDIEIIKPESFVQVSEDYSFKRFFNYWNKAQKSAFLINGGRNA